MAHEGADQAQRRHNARVNPPPPLNVKKGAAEWKIFRQMWDNYCIVARLAGEEEQYKKALFLHTLGHDGLCVYNGMKFEENHKVDDILEAFDTHFIGKTNETYERYMFNMREQKSEESFEDYVAALRTLMKTCRFCDHMTDSLLRDRIVLGIRSNSTRKLLLQEAELTLQSCLDKCRAAEATSTQMRLLKPDDSSTESADVCAASPKGKMKKSCKFCNKPHVMKKEACPAWGKTCKICSGKNHFAVKCKQQGKGKKKLHTVGDDSDPESTESEDLYA